MAEQLDAPSERSIALYALATALGAREQFRERAQVAMQRAAITHDPRFLDLRERVDSLLAGADALMNIGEYAQARSYLLQGESLAQQMRDLSRLAYAVAKLGECCFYLDRWDETLEFAMRRHALVQQYGLERIGRQCFYCGITASVHALRGEREQSVYWRDEAMNYMAGMLWSSNIEMWPRAGRY
jgi:tetratricopeptide (TPR) repeat protein